MSYELEFQQRLDAIDARAKAAGTSLTELCRKSGTARSTPDRWRKVTPKTVLIVTQLEAELTAIEKARAPAVVPDDQPPAVF